MKIIKETKPIKIKPNKKAKKPSTKHNLSYKSITYNKIKLE